MAKATQPGELVDRVQELTARLDGLEPEVRDTAFELLGSLMELYGRGLERILEGLDKAPEVRDELVDDGLVASLLLIHGLYPVDLETRVREALDRVRPYMESHGGGVELLGLEDDVARLRLEGSCNGCGASASTLELAIVQALEESAPDLLGIEVEGASTTPAASRDHSHSAPTPISRNTSGTIAIERMWLGGKPPTDTTLGRIINGASKTRP
jgi:Fe-S cluster biogenesis protein NfuA